MKMTMYKLFLLFAMAGATGLIAMDPDSGMTSEDKQAHLVVLQGKLLASSVESIVKRYCDGQVRVQFGYNLRDLKDTHEIVSFYTSRPTNEKVPQREKDIIQILNQCLAIDLERLLQGEHTDQVIAQALSKYERIPAVKSPLVGDTASENIIQMLASKDGIGTRNFLNAILEFRPQGRTPIGQSMQFLFCGSILGIATLCGIYYVFFAKKTVEEPDDGCEDDAQENDGNEKQDMINEQA